MEGRAAAAAAGTLGEQELGWVEVQDPRRREEESFAVRREEAVRRR